MEKREKARQYWFVVQQLTARELKRKYARSVLGVVWSVLNPLLSMAVLLALRVLWPHSDGDNVLLVSLLCAIGPAASAITQMAQLYHNPNSGYVSSINVLTTLLCAVTMPVMVLLFQLGLDLL